MATNSVIHWYLKNHPLFSGLNEGGINTLCSIAEYKTAKRNAIIYSHSEEKNKFYILNHGRIKIAFFMDGVEVICEILKEEDIFGELTLKKASNTNHEFSQVLSDEASFYSFDLEKLKSLLNENPQTAFTYAKMLADKLKIINTKYSDLIFKNTRDRVLNFFNLHARYEGKWTGNKVEINMFCTHTDIANFTASRRQTVSTIINDLIKERKIIYEGRSKVIIPDIKRLQA